MSQTAPWNKEAPVPQIPGFIGRGEYLAYDGFFACRDERESMWRMSRVVLIPPKSMQFEYIGTFANETEIIAHINHTRQTRD